jgi:hypothetical protein
MPELRLEDFRQDVISHLDPPDFAEIVRRDQRSRRRQRVVVASIIASVVMGTAFALGNGREPRSLEPTKPNGPEIKTEDASGLFATLPPGTTPSEYTLNPNGDLLAYWTVGESDGDDCAVKRAFSWRGADGATRNWISHERTSAMRPLEDGFVVGGSDGEEGPCDPKGSGIDERMYFVDSEGRLLKVAGLASASDTCADDVLAPECEFSLADASVTHRKIQDEALGGVMDIDGTYWYQGAAANGMTIRWAKAGDPFREQLSPFAHEAALDVNGDAVFQASSPQLFRTVDHGETWTTVDISAPLEGLGCGPQTLEWAAATSSGTFAGICRYSQGRVMFRSLDTAWKHFRGTSLEGAERVETTEIVSVSAAGDLLFAENRTGDGIWISDDQGVSWAYVEFRSAP